MSYPLCVFLDSCAQVRLSVDHPFYYLVYESFDYFIRSPFLLRDAAALRKLRGDDEAVKKQRVEEIKQYMQTNFPTVSGSDSTAKELTTLVRTRAYSSCHGEDYKSKKPARKHVYIQKSLVDAWMNSHSAINSGKTGRRGHHL
jgi:hypothetical protein